MPGIEQEDHCLLAGELVRDLFVLHLSLHFILSHWHVHGRLHRYRHDLPVGLQGAAGPVVGAGGLSANATDEVGGSRIGWPGPATEVDLQGVFVGVKLRSQLELREKVKSTSQYDLGSAVGFGAVDLGVFIPQKQERVDSST